MPEVPDELGVLGVELDGRYRIDRLIGAGTMGSVYQGTQVAVGRPVAIKLLNAALKSQQEVRDRFRVEAQAIAKLSHPNCLTLYDFGYSEEVSSLYMAVEYLDGRPLDVLIQTGLDAATALLLARQIADVLAAAHEVGIMHRDLKPENVMVIEGKDGPQAKVLDFGLARIFEDADGGARLTRHGQLFGTPAYMSPEQCHSAMEVGPPADVYALGVSMFEMLTGRLPFESPSVAELLVLHSTKTAPPVAAGSGIPLEISALIARMLAKNADDRPTAKEASAVLTAVLEGTAIPSLPPVRQRSPGEVLAGQPTLAMIPPSPLHDVTATGLEVHGAVDKRANLGGLAALLVLLFLGIGAAAWSISTSSKPPEVPAKPELAVVAQVPPAEVVTNPAIPESSQALLQFTAAAAVDIARQRALHEADEAIPPPEPVPNPARPVAQKAQTKPKLGAKITEAAAKRRAARRDRKRSFPKLDGNAVHGNE